MKKYLSTIYLFFLATFLISSCRKWELEKIELLPQLKTSAATNITLTTAKVGGIFEVVGSQIVDEYGHCWAENPNPTINDARNTLREGKKVGDFTSELTNLKPNTSYFVRAYAKIGNKIVYANNEINVRTLRLPSIEIIASQDITSTGARIFVGLSDLGNPNATVYGVVWATTPNPVLATSPSRTTMNVTNMGTLQTEMSNLQLNTTYYVRAYATNEAGTAYSSRDFIVQTTCSLAEATLQSTPSNLQSNTATVIVSSIKANCDKLSLLELQYTTEPNFNNPLRISNISSANNSSVVLPNLLPNTTYYARIYAGNSAGFSFSNVISFTTPCALPTLVAQTVSNITTTTASISATITSINCTNLTNSGFSLATNSSFSNATNFPNTSNSINFTQNFSNLMPNTTYFVRAYATNSIGIAYSTTQSFTTIAILSVGVETVSFSNLSATSATLNGNITNLGNSNSVTAGFLISSTSQIPLLNGAGVSNIGTQTRTNIGSFTTTASLQSGVTYYFRAYSINSLGTVSYGNVLTFTTVALPTVLTLAAINITLNSANLQGSLQNLGNVSTVSIGFVIATANQNPLIGGTNVTNIPLGNATASSTISSTINNLQAGTTYFFRFYATNSAGTNYGQVLSFTTLSLPTITTLAATNITSTGATFNLNLTSLGSNISVNVGFVFSTSNTNPTIGGSGVTNSTVLSIGNIGTQSINSTNLQANTTYYVRAYATSNLSTTPIYGQVVSFTTALNCGLVSSGIISCFLFDGNLTDGTGNYTASQQNTSFIANRKNINTRALFFGGTTANSRLNISNATYTSSHVNFSLSFWLRANETNRFQTLFSTSSSNQQIYISQNTLFYFADNANIASVTIGTSVWYHYVISYQASNRTTSIYINGSLLVARMSNNSITLSPTLLFGHNGQTTANNANIFNGVIDDLRMYNRTLTQSEITQLYNE